MTSSRNFGIIGKYRAFAALVFAVGAAFIPFVAFAQANLFISPSSGIYKAGELFSVLVNANTGGATVNAAAGLINFDNTRLEVSSVGFARSIFTLWTDEPSFSNAAGTAKFSGGLPNPGFTGASGNIFRITFRAKKAGQAMVVFSSGSVLANDGKGTNILDSFRGGIYNIIVAEKSSAEKKAEPSALKPVEEVAEKTISAPVITEWPAQLEEGTTLMVRGLAFPQSRVFVFFQKGTGDADIVETFAGPDGRFAKTYGKAVSSGFYRVWAKNIGPGDIPGPSSETVTIEVVQPLFFRIGTIAINYISLIITLVALLVFMAMLLIAGWVWARKLQKVRGKEIAEAEEVLHRSFDTLRDGLSAYLSYLFEAKSRSETRHREDTTKRELKKELEDLEGGIKKEIEDIRGKKKN